MGARLTNARAQIEALDGQPLHRSTVVATAGAPKDNVSTVAAGSVTYTFNGGETVLIQPDGGDVYVEFIASASMTASGGKAVRINDGMVMRFILKSDQAKISVDPVSGTAVKTRMFELF